MQLTTIIFASAMLATSVIAEADPDPLRVYWKCYRRGQPCQKLKRAIESTEKILAERSADPEALQVYWKCYRRGQPCQKVKRAEDSLATILANAKAVDPDANPAPQFKQGLSKRSAEPEPKADPEALQVYWKCYRRGQPCQKVKRAVENLAHATSEPEPEEWVDAANDPEHADADCWTQDGACTKAKRSLDALKEDAHETLKYITKDLN
jgi:hypothetical protein